MVCLTGVVVTLVATGGAAAPAVIAGAQFGVGVGTTGAGAVAAGSTAAADLSEPE